MESIPLHPHAPRHIGVKTQRERKAAEARMTQRGAMSTRVTSVFLALLLLFLVGPTAAQTLTGTQLQVSGSGPHAIGGVTNTDVGLNLLGTFAGSANAVGAYFSHTLAVPANGVGYGVNISPMITKADSGTHSDFVGLNVGAPTIGAGAAALTNATTLKIVNAPSGATNNYALWVDAGETRLDGNIGDSINRVPGIYFGTTGLDGAGPIVTRSVGSHAIGGAVDATAAIAFLGAFTGVSHSIGLSVAHTLSVPAGGVGYGINLTPVIAKAGSGTHAEFAGLNIAAPVIGAGAAALTNATTLKIVAAPTGATNNYALWVAGGTTRLGGTLHVEGDVQIDGNIAAKYQDVAEWVRSEGELPAGTVVIIDPREPNRVAISDKAYDTKAAGVVSLRPGLLLGEGGEDKAKVASSGRVRVKADARGGPIAVGDLLVTSQTPGYAMRSEPINIGGTAIHRPGTLLGKALEPLSEGRGEILVLLTLQ